MPKWVDLIDLETGEYKEKRLVYSQKEIADKEQAEKERRQKTKEYFENKACKKAYHKYLNSLKGDFVMLLYNMNEALDYGISLANLTRLIYLSTYVSYNNNRLETADDVMTMKSMEQIMHISPRAFELFYNELISKGILLKQDDGYYLDFKLFAKGKLRNEQLSKNRIQLYIKGVRTLYNKATPREHKLLAYLYQAIPYVNINNNIISHNLLESNPKYVKPMTIEEYCARVGYSVANVRRFKSEVLKFRLQEMPVFNFVKNCDGEFIFINPYVYYGGNKWDEVAVLGGFTTQDKLDKKFLEMKGDGSS